MRPILLFAILLAFGGCVSPKESADLVDDGGDVIVEPDPLLDVTSPTVAVSASPDAFAEIAAWMGPSNTITLANAMTIERPDVTLNLPAKASLSYEFSEDVGRFTFSTPLPTVTASVLGFHVSPSLKSITLKPDGSGVASTGLGRRGFRWLADEADESDGGSAAAENSLPEVWCYSQPGCVPCVRARLELAAETDLPFKVVWKEDAAPKWLAARPAFWWHVSSEQPSQSDVNNTRQTTGWNGIKDFVERWKNSRTPKKFQRSFQAGQAGVSARPDHDIGSRSVARWSINGDFTPSRSTLLSHLTQDGIHRGRHDAQMLHSLTTEQLRWLHDRDHGN